MNGHDGDGSEDDPDGAVLDWLTDSASAGAPADNSLGWLSGSAPQETQAVTRSEGGGGRLRPLTISDLFDGEGPLTQAEDD